MNTTKLTDKQLLNLCQQYGENARLWRQKFAGLLPEVNRRHLYLKKGFSSIYDFAYTLAGMTKKQVQRVLQLERKFEDTHELKRLLIEGEISVNKLVKVGYVSTPENEEYLVEKVQTLSQNSIETVVRDIRYMESLESDDSKNQIGLFEPQIEGKSVLENTFYEGENGGAGAGEGGPASGSGGAYGNEPAGAGITQDKEELSEEVRTDEAQKRAEGKEVRKYVGVSAMNDELEANSHIVST